MDAIFKLLISNFMYLAGTALLLLFLGLILFINVKLNGKLTEIWRRIVDYVKGRHKIDIAAQHIISNINNDLSAIRGEYNADRAYIFEFHNGSEFASKMPQWRVSQTYEKVKAGITHEGQNLQNIPATLIWDDFLKIFFTKSDEPLPNGIKKYIKNPVCKGGCQMPRGVYLVDVASMDVSVGPIKAMLEKRGINFILQTPIVTSSGLVVGWVGIDYCRIDDVLEIENEIEPCSLCKFASQIALAWEMNKSVKDRMITNQKKIWNKYESP